MSQVIHHSAIVNQQTLTPERRMLLDNFLINALRICGVQSNGHALLAISNLLSELGELVEEGHVRLDPPNEALIEKVSLDCLGLDLPGVQS